MHFNIIAFLCNPMYVFYGFISITLRRCSQASVNSERDEGHKEGLRSSHSGHVHWKYRAVKL